MGKHHANRHLWHFAILFFCLRLFAGHLQASSDRILFLSVRRNEGSGIYMVRADGTNQKPVLVDTHPDSTTTVFGLAWAPNGIDVAWELRPHWAPSNNYVFLLKVNEELMRDERDISTVEREPCLGLAVLRRMDCITNFLMGEAGRLHPTFTLDSKKLLHFQMGRYTTDIYASALDRSGSVNLTKDEKIQEEMMNFAYAPDPVAAGKKLMSLPKPIGASQAGRRISLSPDGKVLVFSCVSEKDLPPHMQSATYDNTEICLMNTNRTGFWRLTNDFFADYIPAFSPDGKRIIFESNRGGDFQIYEMNLSGGEVKALTKGPGQNVSPCYSPDGSKSSLSPNATATGRSTS